MSGEHGSRLSSLRVRLRRLIAARETFAAETEKLKSALAENTDEALTALSMLEVYSGPRSAELFRMSFEKVAVKPVHEPFYEGECLQLSPGDTQERSGLIPYYTSLLTSPQADWASRRAGMLVDSLWEYVNHVLKVKFLDATICRLRTVLQRSNEAGQHIAGRKNVRRILALEEMRRDERLRRYMLQKRKMN